MGALVYSCSGADEHKVIQALADLGQVLLENYEFLDFVTITMVRKIEEIESDEIYFESLPE